MLLLTLTGHLGWLTLGRTNILPTAWGYPCPPSCPYVPGIQRVQDQHPGRVILTVKGMSDRSCSTLQLFYIADKMWLGILSLSTLRGLGVVPQDSPRVAELSEVGAAHTAKLSNSGVVLCTEDLPEVDSDITPSSALLQYDLVLCSNTLLDLLTSKQGLTSHHNLWTSV